jgi:dipeptidyl aminopeptidase/acylaminoacyl peptidase
MDEGHMAEQLRLVRIDAGAETPIDSQLNLCGSGLGAYGLGGWFWSPNSRYFYYTDAREGVPDGSGGSCWDRSLIRLDVTSGTIERLGRIWGLSPDGTVIAMWQRSGDDLILWSLDEGEIERAPVAVPDAEVCEIAWSPDGQALAYLQSLCPFCGPAQFSVVHLDLSGLEQTVLVELEYLSVGMQWDTANQIKLWGYEGGKRVELLFDLATGELRPAPQE